MQVTSSSYSLAYVTFHQTHAHMYDLSLQLQPLLPAPTSCPNSPLWVKASKRTQCEKLWTVTLSTMPPRKSRAKPKPELDTGQPDAEARPKHQRAPDIQWVKNPNWTDTLLEYLHDNFAFRIKLFSDSTADATKQAQVKLTAKDGKVQQYTTLAKYIFATKPGQSSLYFQNPSRFGTASRNLPSAVRLSCCACVYIN